MARHGGKRTGTPGKAYPQRSDLNKKPRGGPQPAAAPSGLPYGQRQQLERAQNVIPLPGGGGPAPQIPVGAGQAPAPVPTGAGGPAPGDATVPIGAPTLRPNEAVTTGLPMGPGAGPEALPLDPGDDTALQIKALYQLFPSDAIGSLLELYENGY